MTNVAEGFERGSNKDFVKFLFIARGSSGEVRSLLYAALDQDYITENDFNSTHKLCIQSSKIIWGLIKNLRGKSGWITGLKIPGYALDSSWQKNRLDCHMPLFREEYSSGILSKERKNSNFALFVAVANYFFSDSFGLGLRG